MISGGFGPSLVEIKSLGIGLSHTSNIEELDLADDEFLVIGEQYTPDGGTSKDTIYNLLVNKDVVGIHTSRRRIDPQLNESVKTSSLYIGSDVICDGNILAKSVQVSDVKFDNINSNLLSDLFDVANQFTPSFYKGDSVIKKTDEGYDISVDNLYVPSMITLGNIGDTYGNANPLNIAQTANYNIKNAQISIKNKILEEDTDEPANFRIGIIGDAVNSPAVFSTTNKMPIAFHVGISSEDINILYSEKQVGPNYNLLPGASPSLNIDANGNVGIGVTETNYIEYKENSNLTKLKVIGNAEIDNIFTHDYYTKTSKHLDDIYVRKLGLTFEANQIIPGEFDGSGPFSFLSDLYIGSSSNNVTLEVNDKLNVIGDLNVSNNTIMQTLHVDKEAYFKDTALFEHNLHINKDAIIDNNLLINSGSIIVDNTRINISTLNPIMVDAEIANSMNINGSNVLIYASSDVINLTSGSNMAIPGRLGCGIEKSDTYNHQMSIVKRNSLRYELSLLDMTTGEDDTVRPEVLIGHQNNLPDINFIKDRSLIINTSETSSLHNIYFYPGIDQQYIKNTIPVFCVHQNGTIGVNTKEPRKTLDVSGDIICNDIYVQKNNESKKALFFISRKAEYVKLGDVTKDFFYLYDSEGITKYTINLVEKGNNTLKGLNVSGGIHAVDGGYYESNKKVSTIKLIDENSNKSYINNNIVIGVAKPSKPDANMFTTPLSIRNLSKENYNDSILRFYRGNRQGGALNSAKYSGIDICDYDSYRVDILNDINYNKWFMYKNHTYQINATDKTAMVGPLQFGYTDGTIHPEHYGMTMYFDKSKERYHIDVNNPNIYTSTYYNFPQSAMSIHGDLDVHGNINIINKGNSDYRFKIDGINVSPGAIGETTGNTLDEQNNFSEATNEIVITGSKIAAFTNNKSMYIGHKTDGYGNYIKNSQSSIPLRVYQNDSSGISGQFISGDISTIELSSIDILKNNYNGEKKSSVKLTSYSDTESKNSVFKISPYVVNSSGDELYKDAISVYNNGLTNHVHIGSEKTTNNKESEKIGLHVDSHVDYLLQLTTTSATHPPTINLHHKDGINNSFWMLKGPDNSDTFRIQNSYSLDSYLPNSNLIKNVMVMNRNNVGINVNDAEYALHVKSETDNSVSHLTNVYSDVLLNEKYSAMTIINSNLEYSKINHQDGVYVYDNIRGIYKSGISYYVDSNNFPPRDINNEKIYNDLILSSNILIYKSIINSNEILLPVGNSETIGILQTNDNIFGDNQNMAIYDEVDNIINISNLISYLPDVSDYTNYDITFKTSNLEKIIEIDEQKFVYNFITLNSISGVTNIAFNVDKTIDENNDVHFLNTVNINIGESEYNDKYIIENNETIIINSVSNYITTSNIFNRNTNDLFDVAVENITKKIMYYSELSGPYSIINDLEEQHITYTSDLIKNGDNYKYTINNTVDFLKNVPDGLFAGYTFVDNKTLKNISNVNIVENLQLFNKQISLDIDLNDNYVVYDFITDQNIVNINLDINTVKYNPHFILKNNVYTRGNEIQFGRLNEIYSKDGDIQIISKSKDTFVKDVMLNITSEGNTTITGELTVKEHAIINKNLYTSNLILRGDIYDRLGNSMTFNYSEDMYNKAFVMQTSNYILYTSNYFINSTSNLEFVLQGDHTTKGFTIKKENENLGDFQNYEIFNVIDAGDIPVFTIKDGGFVGIKTESDDAYDLKIRHNALIPHVISSNIDSDNYYGSLMHVGNAIVSGSYIGDASRVSNVFLADRLTDNLPEGSSNRYIVNNQYICGEGEIEIVGNVVVSGSYVGDASMVSNVNLLDKNTDELIEGTSNRYIVDDVYNVVGERFILRGDGEINGTMVFNGPTISVGEQKAPAMIIEGLSAEKKTLTVSRNNKLNDYLHIFNVSNDEEENIIEKDILKIDGDGKVKIEKSDVDENDYTLDVDGKVFARYLTIDGTIKASNLEVLGETTIINTNSYTTENLEIVTSDALVPAFSIIKMKSAENPDSTNILSIVTKVGENIENRMIMDSDGSVNFYNGNITAKSFTGTGTNLQDLFVNYDSDMLKEGKGSNLYYTKERSTNISNYVLSSSNEILRIGRVLDSNASNYVLRSSNTNSLNTKMTSNQIMNEVKIQDNNTSNYITTSSNEILRIGRILDANISNYVLFSSNELSSTLSEYIEITSNEISLNISNVDNLIRTYYDERLDLMWNINNDRISYGNINVYTDKIIIDTNSDTENIVAWYKLKEDAVDYGMLGNNLQIIGTKIGNLYSPNGGIKFNNDIYLVSDFKRLSEVYQEGLSVSIAFRLDEYTINASVNSLFVLKNTTTGKSLYGFIINNSLKIQYTDYGSYIAEISLTDYLINGIIHIAIIVHQYNSFFGLKPFFNGQQIQEEIIINSILNFYIGDKLTIGADISNGNKLTNGKISDFRFYQSLLSQQDIQNIINNLDNNLAKVVINRDLINTSNILADDINDTSNFIKRLDFSDLKTIFASNKILIGNNTTTPTTDTKLDWNGSKLDVNGDINLGNGKNFKINNIILDYSHLTTTFNTGRILFGQNTSTPNSTDNLFWDNTNNRIGIGTNSPQVSLHINKTDALKLPKGTDAQRPSTDTSGLHKGYIRYNTEKEQFEGFGAGNAWGSLGGVMNIAQDTYISATEAKELKFFTNNLERIKIQSDGNIGIGKTPTHALDVNGDINIANGKKFKINGNNLSYNDLTNKLTAGTNIIIDANNTISAASTDLNGVEPLINLGGTEYALVNTTGGKVGVNTFVTKARLETLKDISTTITIQAQLNGKEPTISLGGTEYALVNTTGGKVAVTTAVTKARLETLSDINTGLTIQAQLNGKEPSITVLGVAKGGTGASTLEVNKLLVGNATSAIQAPSNLHWDKTNNRLGIVKTTPGYTLDVGGDINCSGVFRLGGVEFTGGNTGTTADIDSIEIGGNTDNTSILNFPRENIPATPTPVFSNNSFEYTYSAALYNYITVKTRVSSFSSSSTTNIWKIFDGSLTTGSVAGWQSNNGYTATGVANTTYRTGYNGEWIMVDLGEKIVFKNFEFSGYFNTNSLPRDFSIYGTNDKNVLTGNVNSMNWNEIGSFSIIHSSGVVKASSDLGNTDSYRIYMIIINQLQGSSTSVAFNELKFKGYPFVPEIDIQGNLLVRNEIYSYGDITAFYSDIRLKKVISNIPEPLKIINDLNGFYYEPNSFAKDFDYGENKKHIGLSAQEVQKVLPEIVKLAAFDTVINENNEKVSKSGENYLTIAYDKLAPLFVEGIKELNKKVEYQNDIIQKLMQEIETLKSKLV